MVHGILQFTPSIAFRYVLHRCKSRDIRCRESFSHSKDVYANAVRKQARGHAQAFVQLSLARFAPGFVVRRVNEHVARKLRQHLLARGRAQGKEA